MVVKEKKDSNGETQQNFFVPAVFNGKFEDGAYIQEHPEGGNLAYYLKTNGYKENINLFVFNYPNEDAVVHSAEKFKKYIDNLINYVRTSGTDEMKACFYTSRSEYVYGSHKINLVGHSMGGLVSRYYIENLGQDRYVDKLITICTPHWGSGYGKLSGDTNIEHKLCDHDLDFNSAMYGGANSTTINCNKGNCPESNYTVTPALQYERQRSTRYYAIAGIDYYVADINRNDKPINLPTTFTTYQQISDYLKNNSIHKKNGKKIIPMSVTEVGDNVVGFMSQIGWTEDEDAVSPSKKISMEKIFVDVDTNGGNGEETFIYEAILEWFLGNIILHSKIPHRIPVIEKIIEFLGE